MSAASAELPQGWCVSTIADLCDLNPRHDSALKGDLPVSFVPMAAVSDVEGQIADPLVRALCEVKNGFTHFADGDVIMAKITPCMENGKAASVRGMVNGLACGTTEFFVLRPRGAIDQDYLFHFIRQESFRRAARATMQSGVGQARVPKEFVLETEIPLAPLAEQRRIVAKIEEFRSRSRKAREAVESIPPLLEQYRQSVLAAAFRGDLTAVRREQNPDSSVCELLDRVRQARREEWEAGNPNKKYCEPQAVNEAELPELPEGWCWSTLAQVSSAVRSIQYGVIQPGEDLGDGIRLVRVCDIFDGKVSSSNLRTISAEVERNYNRTRLKGGELLVTVVGTIGRVAVADASLAGANIARAVARVVPLLIPCEWLHAWLSTSTMQHRLLLQSREVARKTLNISELEQIPVPVASQAEMLSVLNNLSFHNNRAERVSKALDGCDSGLRQLDESILAKAFRGELVPQDPSDEPASALIDRIKAERGMVNGHRALPAKERSRR